MPLAWHRAEWHTVALLCLEPAVLVVHTRESLLVWLAGIQAAHPWLQLTLSYSPGLSSPLLNWLFCLKPAYH